MYHHERSIRTPPLRLHFWSQLALLPFGQKVFAAEHSVPTADEDLDTKSAVNFIGGGNPSYQSYMKYQNKGYQSAERSLPVEKLGTARL